MTSLVWGSITRTTVWPDVSSMLNCKLRCRFCAYARRFPSAWFNFAGFTGSARGAVAGKSASPTKANDSPCESRRAGVAVGTLLVAAIFGKLVSVLYMAEVLLPVAHYGFPVPAWILGEHGAGALCLSQQRKHALW